MVTSNTQPLLSVLNLRIEFPTRRGTLVAVDDISFNIAPGEILGVVGESGAGKSLTGAAIIRLLEPPGRIVQGQVLLEGQRIDNLPYEEMRKIRGRRIGAIFQDPLTSLNPLYSVGRQLIETIQTHLPLSDREARDRALELLEEVGIPSAAERIGHYPHQFSGGMRQRVVIALALCAEPRLIIADEPTTALDVTIQAQILDLLKELQNKHDMSVILITHNLGIVSGYTDDVAVMYAGKIVEKCSTDELISNPIMPYTEALMNSAPSLAYAPHTRLQAIPGLPPNLLNLPEGCSFQSRCNYKEEKCSSYAPDLTTIKDQDHKFACWYPLDFSGTKEPLNNA